MDQPRSTSSSSTINPNLNTSHNSTRTPDKSQMNETDTMPASPKKFKISKRSKRKKKQQQQPLTLFGILLQGAVVIPTVIGVLLALGLLILKLFLGCLHGGKRRKEAIDHARLKLSQLCCGSTREILAKIIMFLWFVLVVCSVLSLVGIRVALPFENGSEVTSGEAFKESLLNRSTNRLHITASSYLFGSSDMSVTQGMQQNRAGNISGGDEDDEDARDEVPEQEGLNTEKKTWRKKDEIKLACGEMDCNTICINKMSKRCSKSEGCVKRRSIDCRKKCRKQRCDTRCKNEPILGYVDKEQKMEVCKEECNNNEKCMNKCEKLMESCRVKCKDNLKRFTCNRAPSPVLLEADASEEKAAKTPALRQSQLSTSVGLDEKFDSESVGDTEELGDEDDSLLDAI